MARNIGEMLKNTGAGLYCGEGNVHLYGAGIQTRMSVVSLPDGGVFVISPLILTEELKRAPDVLGPVRHIASPNKIHNQGLTSFAEAYREAQLWAWPGLVEQRPDIRFAGTLDDTPHLDWAPVLGQLVTPGNFFFSEVVFYHCDSKTLIVADLVENIADETVTSCLGRQMAKAMHIFGRPLPPSEFRMYTCDADAAGARLDEIGTWDFQRILIARGTVITEDAHRVLRDVRDLLTAEVASRSTHRAGFCRFLAS